MTSRDFCFWLQGYLEVASADGRAALSDAQVECVRRHLALVFRHEIDPSMGGEAHQAVLNETHAPKPKPGGPAFHGAGCPGGLVMRC